MANKYTTFCTRSVLLFNLVLANNGNFYTHGGVDQVRVGDGVERGRSSKGRG